MNGGQRVEFLLFFAYNRHKLFGAVVYDFAAKPHLTYLLSLFVFAFGAC
jgi:hypothetical protein